MRTIFYSWQLDAPPELNRDFIRAALENASKRLVVQCEIDESARGIVGSPPFFSVITGKIDRCAVLVADLTLVIGAGSRKSCNPNVLIEYGYALARLGERKLITVMNRSYGSPELLPSDIRGIIVNALYDLPEGADELVARSVRDKLEEDLYQALRSVLEDPRSVLNLSDPEFRIAEYILKSSKRGRGGTYYKAPEISEALGLDIDVVNRSVAELASRGYLERLSVAGTDSPPFGATPPLYWDLDVYVFGWSAREDARTIARAVVESSSTGHGRLATKKFADQEQWPLRRINPALQFLVSGSLVRESRSMDPDVVTVQVSENELTRAFLRREFDPDTVRRGLPSSRR